MKCFSYGLATTSCSLLMGCGSGQTSPVGNYVTFESNVPEVSQLSGNAIVRTNPFALPPYQISEVEGTLQHDTQGIVIDTSSIRLFDPSGQQDSGILLDLNNNNVNGQFAPYSEGYDYVQAFSVSDMSPELNLPSTATGYIGVPTLVADIPDSGRAEFEGIANGIGVARVFNDVPTTVSADFENESVDLLASQDLGGGRSNTIQIVGMELQGHEFRGGAILAKEINAEVDTSSFGSEITGEFFGYDLTQSGPDEVGVFISSRGTDGYNELIVLAD